LWIRVDYVYETQYIMVEFDGEMVENYEEEETAWQGE
jgi:hypothetical protein